MNPSVQELHRRMVAGMSDDDLRNVVFYLSDARSDPRLRYDSLGDSFEEVARNLIGYCRDRRCLSQLIALIKQTVPTVLAPIPPTPTPDPVWDEWAQQRDTATNPASDPLPTIPLLNEVVAQPVAATPAPLVATGPRTATQSPVLVGMFLVFALVLVGMIGFFALSFNNIPAPADAKIVARQPVSGGTAITFGWEPVPVNGDAVVTYMVETEIFRDGSFQPFRNTPVTRGTQLTFTFQQSSRWRWRVFAVVAGKEGNKSDWVEFQT